MQNDKITISLTTDDLSMVLDTLFATIRRQSQTLNDIQLGKTCYGHGEDFSHIDVQPNGSWIFWDETSTYPSSPFDTYEACKAAYIGYCAALDVYCDDLEQGLDNETTQADNSGRASNNQTCCGADAQTYCACRRQGEASGR